MLLCLLSKVTQLTLRQPYDWNFNSWFRLGRMVPWIHKLLIIWVRSRNCGCLVTWFCYQLIAKPGNKTPAVSWPDSNSHQKQSQQNGEHFMGYIPHIPINARPSTAEHGMTGNNHYVNYQCYVTVMLVCWPNSQVKLTLKWLRALFVQMNWKTVRT